MVEAKAEFTPEMNAEGSQTMLLERSKVTRAPRARGLSNADLQVGSCLLRRVSACRLP